MSSENEGNRRSDIFPFGDWNGHLNRAEGRCSQRILASWSTLDGKVRRRGFSAASTDEKRKSAFVEIESFVLDAVNWCQHEQDRGTWVASPFTESREAEVISAVHSILDWIASTLAETVPTNDKHRSLKKSCDARKSYFEQNLILPSFYDGRADFQPTKDTTPTSEPWDWLREIAWNVHKLVSDGEENLKKFHLNTGLLQNLRRPCSNGCFCG